MLALSDWLVSVFFVCCKVLVKWRIDGERFRGCPAACQTFLFELENGCPESI